MWRVCGFRILIREVIVAHFIVPGCGNCGFGIRGSLVDNAVHRCAERIKEWISVARYGETLGRGLLKQHLGIHEFIIYFLDIAGKDVQGIRETVLVLWQSLVDEIVVINRLGKAYRALREKQKLADHIRSYSGIITMGCPKENKVGGVEGYVSVLRGIMSCQYERLLNDDAAYVVTDEDNATSISLREER